VLLGMAAPLWYSVTWLQFPWLGPFLLTQATAINAARSGFNRRYPNKTRNNYIGLSIRVAFFLRALPGSYSSSRARLLNCICLSFGIVAWR
jgi:hypothetical protein